MTFNAPFGPTPTAAAAYACLLLKTGQTTQYGGYEDDGYLEKGEAKSYTVLTAGQYSGTTNVTLNGKTDAHSNNCVLDLNTGLMWQRYHFGSIGPTSNGKLPWTTNVNGEGIFTACAAANAASLSGYTDWRVPNIAELCGLLVFEGTSKPNSTAFPSWPTASTQSSTTFGANTIYSLDAQYYALIGYVGKTTADDRLILVRGG
jgi:hypothetical protein